MAQILPLKCEPHEGSNIIVTARMQQLEQLLACSGCAVYGMNGWDE